MFASTARRYDSERLHAWTTRGTSTLVTAPEVEPVDVDMLKRHARLNDDAAIDYDLLPLRIQATREWVERYVNRALIRQTWDYTIDWHPDGYGPIWLPKSPLIDVTSITWYDTATGAATVIPSTDYRVDVTTVPGRVISLTGGYWAADPRIYGGLTVRYRAGYGTDPESVPASLRQAIFLLAGELSERLEGASDLKLSEVPFGVKALLDPFVVMT